MMQQWTPSAFRHLRYSKAWYIGSEWSVSSGGVGWPAGTQTQTRGKCAFSVCPVVKKEMFLVLLTEMCPCISLQRDVLEHAVRV